MLLVLPPSEGKTAPQDGDSLNLASLSFPELNAVRSQVLLALVDLCSQDPDRALGTLKLSDSQTDERDRNLLLKSSPCVPAGELYSGVLYDALGLHDMPPGAQARANEQVVTASALWGLVRPTDLIPAYRLSAGVRLPGLPPLQQLWREPVATALVGDSGIIVDLRSTPYRKLAPIPTEAAARTALVRVWQEQGGRRV
ncbi:MAG: peroxide stress protein YaaA, partial [Actinomycetia bacterium]|nr:peroxide stress protein YaaA [Actinomycetes bacterium]